MDSKILVVEDDCFIREVIETTLTDEGYSVDTAADGMLAWEYLTRSRPDLVVLDLALPRMDGLTICKKMRADQRLRTVPVLIASAMTSRSVIRAAIDAGANGFLDKPFDLCDFVDNVQRLLEGSLDEEGFQPARRSDASKPFRTSERFTALNISNHLR